MSKNPVTNRDYGELANRALRELTQHETSLVGGGNKSIGGNGLGGGRFGGCPLPNDYRLGPFCTN